MGGERRSTPDNGRTGRAYVRVTGNTPTVKNSISPADVYIVRVLRRRVGLSASGQ